MFQDDVAHIKTQNVFLQPVLQVLKKPAGDEGAENTLREGDTITEGLKQRLAGDRGISAA